MTCVWRQLVKSRNLAVIIGGLSLGIGLAVVGFDSAFPDVFGALWTRAHYVHRTRLIDPSQYRHTVPITSYGKSDGEEWRPVVLTSAQMDQADVLSQMAQRTSSNIIVANRNGDLLLESYYARSGADSSMLTNSMSMAKTLIGLLVGVAVDRGVIQSVDQPIGDFLEEFEGDVRGKITIKNLLQMESGLADQDSGFPISNLQAMYFGDSPDVRALSAPAVRNPGESFDYNSVNTQILLIILERTLDADLEGLLSEHIWRPLGLDPGFGWRASPTGDAKGFCCVFATARTWAAIGRVFLDTHEGRGRTPVVVSTPWLTEMTKPAREASHYGYHVWLGKTKAGQIPYVSLNGSPQQLVFAFPTIGIVAVRVGDENRRFSVDDFLSAVVAFAVGSSS